MTALVRMVIRFVISAIVLLLVGYITPGFSVAGFTNALLAAVVIALLGMVTESLLGRDVSPYGRGIVGFIVAAVVIFLTQYLVPGVSVSIVGALIAALVIGLVDTFVPTMLR